MGNMRAYEHMTALIVDDDRLIRRQTADLLEDLGFTVEQVKDGIEAVPVFCRVKPNIVLVDMMPPGMDGFSICSQLRKHAQGRYVPILMMTTLEDVDSINRALEAGATDFITKPINWAMLRHRIQYAWRSSAAIESLRRNEEKLIKLAYRDTMTGLLNRLSFKIILKKALEQAERYNRLMAVMFLDLDRFKRINDSLGHNVGDQLLQGVAERILDSMRKSDCASRFSDFANNMVSRLGGDEFTILLTEIRHSQDAAKVARRILKSLSRPFVLADREIFVTASIGITIYPDDGLDVDTLLKNADTAMYNAKDQGRNNFQLFSKPMGSASFEKLALETDLRKAIGRQEFVLYYQPQVDIRSGEILGVEALIRWEHPEMGTVSPAEFIPVAEEAGLIGLIGEWVLRTACAQNKAWHDLGYTDIRMAVNLSSLQFKQRNLVEDVTKALKTTEMDPSCLELELTESAIMQNVEAALSCLNHLKDMGVKIAIDDFGTGYSSLNYLKRFPLDALKIDRSFVRDIIIDQDDAAIAAAIIGMARNLNLRVIAEGVETRAQLDFLSSQQCNEAQGFLFSPALPSDEMTRFLFTHGRNWADHTIFLW
jgi:diguanylate cyclase (GGDEF)-like protein